MAKPELAQWHTHRHTLAPQSPLPQTQASIATRQKRIVLLTNAGFIWPREVFPLCTTPFPAPIKQNTSPKRPRLPLCEEGTINTCSRGEEGGHQEPFHGPRGANEDLEEQVVFPVSQTKGRSSFLKCLKKGKRKGLLLFLNTSLICWKMALKALNNLPAPGDRLRHTRQHPRESQGSRGPSLPQVSTENPLLRSAHHQPTSHLV